MAENWAFGGSPAPLDADSGLVTLVEGSSFCISTSTGDIPAGTSRGLFVRDTRFLSRWEVRIDGQAPQVLNVERVDPFRAAFLCRTVPRPGLADSTIFVVRRRFLGSGMREDLELHNLGSETAGCSVTLLVDADFADIFEVKENRVTRRREPVATADADGLQLDYRWMGQHRGVRITSDIPPTPGPGLLQWLAVVPPRAVWRAGLQVIPAAGERELHPDADLGTAIEQLPSIMRMTEWRRRGTTVRTPHQTLRSTIRRCEEDLGSLRIAVPEAPQRVVVAAGAPWFMALFGRDSLITSWMTLTLDPAVALGTVETLADYQGAKVDPLTEEQPGRILHEIRFGIGSQLALGGGNTYYGTVDATALFVMLLGELRRWGMDADRIKALLPNADRALEWIEKHGDADQDGFVEYRRMTDRGLANQGWKDSWDAITFAKGRYAEAPIALCEVQGYVYGAYLARAGFARDQGETDLAESWERKAADLKRAFNEVFWLPDRGYYALALDADKRPVDSLASNMGHCLWTGIVDDDKAEAVAAHLVGPDLFSGWGVRTLAASMGAYNPMSYHNGSVWPHDNALIAAGLMRYGFVEQAHTVANAILDAAEAFGGRLPELFCGFERDAFAGPVPYPTSCSPQAWAAATPIFLLRTLLRFDPATPDGRLWVAPAVPPRLLPLGVDGLSVDGATLSITVRSDGWDLSGVPERFVVQRRPEFAPEAPAEG